eukprot:363282-Chlamydomonas_euryale.AAC.5
MSSTAIHEGVGVHGIEVAAEVGPRQNADRRPKEQQARDRQESAVVALRNREEKCVGKVSCEADSGSRFKEQQARDRQESAVIALRNREETCVWKVQGTAGPRPTRTCCRCCRKGGKRGGRGVRVPEGGRGGGHRAQGAECGQDRSGREYGHEYGQDSGQDRTGQVRTGVWTGVWTGQRGQSLGRSGVWTRVWTRVGTGQESGQDRGAESAESHKDQRQLYITSKYYMSRKQYICDEGAASSLSRARGDSIKRWVRAIGLRR